MGYFGNWFGSVNGWFGNWFHGSGAAAPVADDPTVDSLRDYIISLIGAITPTTLTRDRFIKYRNEGQGDFLVWALNAPVLRRFQVRDTGSFDAPPSLVDSADEQVTFEILIAYPQTNRYGDLAGQDRDKVMRQDRLLIEREIGRTGYTNFDGSAGPLATPLGVAHAKVKETGVDFTILTATYRFDRSL